MSKKIFYFLSLALSLTMFASCDDDDDDNRVIDYAAQVAGTYSGSLKLNMEDIELPSQDKDITIGRTEVNKVSLELKDFSIANPVEGEEEGSIIPIGDIKVDSISVEKSGNDIILKETTQTVTVDISGIETKVGVTVSGKVNGKKLNIDIKVPLVKVNGAFEGTKK